MNKVHIFQKGIYVGYALRILMHQEISASMCMTGAPQLKTYGELSDIYLVRNVSNAHSFDMQITEDEVIIYIKDADIILGTNGAFWESGSISAAKCGPEERFRLLLA